MVSLSKSTAGVVFAFYPQLRKLSNVRRKKVSLLELRLKVELSFLSKNKKKKSTLESISFANYYWPIIHRW